MMKLLIWILPLITLLIAIDSHANGQPSGRYYTGRSYTARPPAPQPPQQPAVKPQTEVTYKITARMGGTRYAAKQEPTRFSVPTGTQAVVVSFYWKNAPGEKPEWSSTLGYNIYSVTQGKYMADNKGIGYTQLPPGEYSFVVGGYAGAEGTLTYKLVPVGQPIGR